MPNTEPANARQILTTHDKALRVNLDRRRYGTFAEIGAGQEVSRWFFRVGGASGTVAKSMSAYDMAISDAIYGETDRYVSRPRLESMLDHEYSLNLERLAEARGDATAFFAFANTVAARNFKGDNDCHGWLGVRFQVYPRDPDHSQIILHVRLLDKDNFAQQEALGIVGVNLLHGAFFLHHEPEQLVQSLLDGLSRDRIEVDMIEFSGIGFRQVDNRLMSLKLVQLDLSDAAMFDCHGKVLQPSEVFRKRPVLVERGSFRPVTNTNVDMLRAAREKFAAELPEADRGRIVTVAEITMKNLLEGVEVSHRDFLARADALAACGQTVLISDYFEYYRLAAYLNQFTKQPIALALGAISLRDLFDDKYYSHLEGGILESFGRLFKNDLRVYVYPYRNPESNAVETVANTPIRPELRKLYEWLADRNCLIDLDNYDPACLPIFSRDILTRIAAQETGWEGFLPPNVAALIKERGLFGWRNSQR
jgi:hypothetical protein